MDLNFFKEEVAMSGPCRNSMGELGELEECLGSGAQNSAVVCIPAIEIG